MPCLDGMPRIVNQAFRRPNLFLKECALMNQQIASPGSSLVVRTIPFDLDAALRGNGRFGPYWFDDKGIAYLAIGYSFALEYSERFINLADTVLPNFINDGSLRKQESTFNHQEANHAKYHRILNEMVAPTPPTSEKYNPRVYDFFYSNYKTFREPLMQRLFEPQDERELMGAVNETMFRRAAFETVTCITGLTYFDFLFDEGRLTETLSATRTPAVLYLFGYHLAEELEHCTTAFDVYDSIFHEPMWSQQSIAQVFGNPAQSIDHEINSAAFFVAKHAGQELSLSELQNNAFAKRQREIQAEMIAPGFHPGRGACKERKDYFVAKWDREWEPILRDRIAA
ncbi:hypothetical protein CU048_07575 [Beijerinckiaceae bacterium]|nr:hypothetical protein CU048_07575 [Beijerinckiaceae bacterium]